jgi:Phage tail protein (Tail_P2_I)
LPDRPTDVGSFGEAVYQQLKSLTYAEEHVGVDYALLKFVGAIGQMFQQMDHMAHSDELGQSWTKFLDINRIPCEGVPWLGQFVGVDVDTSLTCDEQRQQIRDKLGWQRGTPEAMKSAIRKCLGGTKTVNFRERYPTPYSLMVVTYGEVLYITSTYENMLLAYPIYQQYLEGTSTYPDPGDFIRYGGSGTIHTSNYLYVKSTYPTYTNLKLNIPTYDVMRDYTWIDNEEFGETVIQDDRYEDIYEKYPTYLQLWLGFDSYEEIWETGWGLNTCVVNAIEAYKPAGLVYDYHIMPSQDYWDLWMENGDYNQIYNTYDNYQEIYVGFPTGVHVPFTIHTYAFYVHTLYSHVWKEFSPYQRMYGVSAGDIPTAGLPPATWEIYSLPDYTELWNKEQTEQDVYQHYAAY